MALDIESQDKKKVSIPNFRGMKKGKTKTGKVLSRVGTEETLVDDVSKQNSTDNKGKVTADVETQTTKKVKESVNSKSDLMKKEINSKSAFVVSTTTGNLLAVTKKIGPANSMYYLILKSAVENHQNFLASKKDVSILLGISPHRAGQILKELVDKKLLKVIKAENSASKTGKTYGFIE